MPHITQDPKRIMQGAAAQQPQMPQYMTPQSTVGQMPYVPNVQHHVPGYAQPQQTVQWQPSVAQNPTSGMPNQPQKLQQFPSYRLMGSQEYLMNPAPYFMPVDPLPQGLSGNPYVLSMAPPKYMPAPAQTGVSECQCKSQATPKYKSAFPNMVPIAIPQAHPYIQPGFVQTAGPVYIAPPAPLTLSQNPHLARVQTFRGPQISPSMHSSLPSPSQVRFSPRGESDLFYLNNDKFYDYDYFKKPAPTSAPAPVPAQNTGTQSVSQQPYLDYNPLMKRSLTLDHEREWERIGGLAKYQASMPAPLSPTTFKKFERVAIATASSNIGMISTHALLLQNNFLLTHPDRRKSSMEKIKHKISHRKEDDLHWTTINETYPVSINAGVYDEAAVPNLKEYQNSSEVTIYSGIDADHPETLDSLFQGCGKALIIPSQGSRRVEHTKIMIDAAQRSGVRHIVLLSIYGAQEENFLFARQYRDIEQHLVASGMTWTILRSTFFFQDLLLLMANPGQRMLPLPGGEARWTPVDMADVARAAAIVLTSAGHENRIYNLTGPRSYDGEEFAKHLGTKTRTRLTYQDVTMDEFRTLLIQRGMPLWQAEGTAELFEYYRSGRGDVISPDLQTLLGGSTDLNAWARRNRQRLDADDDIVLPSVPR